MWPMDFIFICAFKLYLSAHLVDEYSCFWSTYYPLDCCQFSHLAAQVKLPQFCIIT